MMKRLLAAFALCLVACGTQAIDADNPEVDDTGAALEDASDDCSMDFNWEGEGPQISEGQIDDDVEIGTAVAAIRNRMNLVDGTLVKKLDADGTAALKGGVAARYVLTKPTNGVKLALTHETRGTVDVEFKVRALRDGHLHLAGRVTSRLRFSWLERRTIDNCDIAGESFGAIKNLAAKINR